MIRIANGQGFWGDSLEAPLAQIRQGPVDYLTLDYLAEVTMSILQKQRARDPERGYASDFVDVMEEAAGEIAAKQIRVVANAGGVNPQACADAVGHALEREGVKLPIGVVAGDDILGRLEMLVDRGIELRNMDTGRPLRDVLSKVRSANVYFGAFPIATALGAGARIVITGRCADAALLLGPAIYEFDWCPQDWDRLAAGVVAGHIIECGAQATGGNCQYDWESTCDFAGIGYPIVEIEPDGDFTVTKHDGTGGCVTLPGVTEQLVYEIGDPRRYITPDVVADFTTIRLQECGPDRVHVSSVRGSPATDTFKVSISYSAGYKAVGTLLYGWPDAARKARAAEQILRTRLERMGLHFDAVHAELVGVNACHGDHLSGEASAALPEVLLRVGVRGSDRRSVERFTRELAPLALNGPPVVTYTGGRPKVEEIMAYWPALIPKAEVAPEVSLSGTYA